jgi:hypothetical protein
MELLGDLDHVDLASFHLDTVLVRCKIGAWFALDIP